MFPAMLLRSYDWTTDTTLMAWVAISSLLIGVLSIIISIWLYRRGIKSKQIGYSVVSDTPIAKVGKVGERGKVRVNYEDASGQIIPIENARLLTLQVKNIGRGDVEIPAWQDTKTEKNIEMPIEFEFCENTIVSLTQVKTNPPSEVILQENLADYLDAPSPTSDRLGLPRCLLKQGQSITLSILLNGDGTIIEQIGLLTDVEIININYIKKRRINLIDRYVFFALILFLILQLIFWQPSLILNVNFIVTIILFLLFTIRISIVPVGVWIVRLKRNIHFTGGKMKRKIPRD